MNKCIKCNLPTDVDIDEWTFIHTRCLNEAVERIDDRTARIERGDTSVENLTPEERKLILERRKEQRNAIED